MKRERRPPPHEDVVVFVVGSLGLVAGGALHARWGWTAVVVCAVLNAIGAIATIVAQGEEERKP